MGQTNPQHLTQQGNTAEAEACSITSGQKPIPKGHPHFIDPVEEEKLVCLVEAMQTMKLAVYNTLFYLVNKASLSVLVQALEGL